MNDDTVDLLKIKIEKAKRELPLDTVNAIDSVDWRAAILGLRAKKGYTFEQLGDLELETELLLAGLITSNNYPKELENRMGISRAQANELVNEMNELVFKKIREELVKNTERKKIFQRNVPPPLSGEDRGEVVNSPHPNPLLTKERGDKNDEAILNKAGIEIIPDLPAVPSAQLMQAGKLELTTSEKPMININRENILEKIEKPEPTIESKPTEQAHPILAQKLSSSFQIPTVKTEHSLDNITKTNIPVSPDKVKNKIPGVDPYRELPE